MTDQTPPQMPLIGIVIPFYNDSEHVRRCLDSINTAINDLPDYCEIPAIIVIDDHSPRPFESENSPLPVTVYRFSENKGVGAARNKGASLCQASHILFLDSDVLLEMHHLSRLYTILTRNPKPIIQGLTSVIPANSEATRFQHYMAIAWNYYELNNWSISVFTQCFLIEKQFFIKLGGFSERFRRSGGEEFELGQRLCENHENSICLDPSLIHSHHFDRLVKRLKKVYFRSRHIRKIALGMPNLPFRFTAQALMRSSFAWVLNLCILSTLIDPVKGVTAYLIAAVLFYLADDSLTTPMARHSIRLSIMSVIFRQLEFTFITLGMARGLPDRRNHD